MKIRLKTFAPVEMLIIASIVAWGAFDPRNDTYTILLFLVVGLVFGIIFTLFLDNALDFLKKRLKRP